MLSRPVSAAWPGPQIMADDRRIRYLTELDASLPMPLERRAEVIEEIDAHLDDAVAAHLERGGAPDEAEAHAQRRLGAPSDLARDLARSEQSPWRLLAAVGASVRVGVGQWLYGFLLGWLLLLLGIYALAGAVQLADRLFEAGWTFQFTDQGWNTLITSGAFAFGLYFAGRAVPRTMSIASRMPVGELRPWVATIGTAATFGLFFFVIEMPLNWASVIGMAAVPLAFSLGVYRPHLLRSRMGRRYLIIVGALVLVPMIGLWSAGTGSSGGVEVADGELPDRGLAMVGPWWADPMTAEEPLLWNIRLGDPRGAGDPYEWELNGSAALAGLRSVRVEAWHSEEGTHGRLDPRFPEPFAVAPIERDGRTLTASLDTSSTPGTNLWELIVTGIGDDGTRYVLDAGTVLNSTFHGSAWDWIVAVSN